MLPLSPDESIYEVLEGGRVPCDSISARTSAEDRPLEPVVGHELWQYSMVTHPSAGHVQDDHVHGRDDGNEPQHVRSA